MTPGLRVLLVLIVLASLSAAGWAAAQTAEDWAEAAARGFDGSLIEGHFGVAWRLEEGSEADVRTLLTVAESAFSRISEIVGVDQTPSRRIMLVLAGHAQASDGSWRAPSVDDRGRVILLRYDDGIQSYSQEITHELVHAFRRHSGHWLSGFIEAGFAEVVAMAVDPDDRGFPRYGYPITIVAGHLVSRQEHLPLARIRGDHAELNRRCQLQAYIERASFFDYLTGLASLDALVQFVYRPTEPTDDDYAAFLGGTFTQLAENWEARLVSDYRGVPDAEETANRYRAVPAVASRPICSS